MLSIPNKISFYHSLVVANNASGSNGIYSPLNLMNFVIMVEFMEHTVSKYGTYVVIHIFNLLSKVLYSNGRRTDTKYFKKQR